MRPLPSTAPPGPGRGQGRVRLRVRGFGPAQCCLLLASALTSLSGCMELLRSDAANAGHRNAEARQEALQGNRLASQQAAPAQKLAGEALTRILTGKSHISEYRKFTSDAQPYYAVYAYYAPDGQYLWLNTYELRDPATTPWGTWQVSGEVLCVTQQRGEVAPNCYTLRLQPDGTVQYWMHQPGDPFHGLLTATVSIIRKGPQTPAFVSSPSQMH